MAEQTKQEKAKTLKAQKAPAKPKSNEDSVVKKVQDFLISKGQEGATALEIGKHLGWVKDGMNKEELRKAGTKIRVYARKAVDTHEKGKRLVRNGRNKIYQIA